MKMKYNLQNLCDAMKVAQRALNNSTECTYQKEERSKTKLNFHLRKLKKSKNPKEVEEK